MRCFSSMPAPGKTGLQTYPQQKLIRERTDNESSFGMGGTCGRGRLIGFCVKLVPKNQRQHLAEPAAEPEAQEAETLAQLKEIKAQLKEINTMFRTGTARVTVVINPDRP